MRARNKQKNDDDETRNVALKAIREAKYLKKLKQNSHPFGNEC